ncbi:ankyrin [Elysia marginata]|uniref:Ankyrin n=1 Tax=Elysia marginata TaxID=1093978 RepID=A0AAV4GSL3_9GAST|nr:ankyrin [Elysia marginata]
MSTKKGNKKKRKSSCGFDGGSKVKAARLNDNIRLTTALDGGDIVAIREVLENKSMKFTTFCLNAALLKAVEKGKKIIVQMILNIGLSVGGKAKTGCLALLSAVEHGYLDIVKQLIKKGVPINGQDSEGKTALMVAVEKSCCSALISYLLNDCKADPNFQDNTGRTVLMLAVEQWDYETAQNLFLGNGCDEQIKDNSGQTAMDLAHKNGFADLLTVLIQSKSRNLPPLNLAAGSNNLKLVRQLLKVSPSCIKEYDEDGSSLTVAMHGLDEEWDEEIHCSLQMLDVLILAGVNVDDTHWRCNLTPLMFAATAGSKAAVQKLLNHGADVNKHRPKHKSALMMAAERGHTGVAELLLQAGADVFTQDFTGETVLTLAVKSGEKSCTRTVLNHWCQLNSCEVELMETHNMLDVLKNVKGRWNLLLKDSQQLHKVFCKAIKAGFYKLVKDLIEHGAKVNFCQNEKFKDSCPLVIALSDTKMLRLLIDMGANIDIPLTASGNTPLMYAAVKMNVKSVHRLLDNGANMYAESDGLTALRMAIQKNKADVVTAFLDKGMDVNYVSSDMQTALWSALNAKNFSLMETLIVYGANVDFASTDGVTILMQAVKNCSLRFMELIIENGANVNAQDANGNSALFHALQLCSMSKTVEDKVSLLLKHGANVNHVNMSTATPLHLAAGQHNNVNVLKALLAQNPQVNAQDINGDTALHVAVQNSLEIKVKVLLGSGADANAVDGEYRTPLMLAFKNLDLIILKTLLEVGGGITSLMNSPQIKLQWKTDLDQMFFHLINRHSNITLFYYNSHYSRYSVCRDFTNCLKALLEAGCSLHAAHMSNLDLLLGICIVESNYEMTRLLLQSGIRPNLMNLSNVRDLLSLRSTLVALNFKYTSASPLFIAILLREQKIVSLFVQACFYHQEDVKMLQDREMQALVAESVGNGSDEHQSLVEELCPKNWPLRTWSKLAVLRAVGYGEGREHRMRALPIPQRLQDELLSKNLCSSAMIKLAVGSHNVTGVDSPVYLVDGTDSE